MEKNPNANSNIGSTPMMAHINHFPPLQAPKDVIEALQNEDITANFHKKCLWVKTFFNNSAIKDFYNILATNIDDNTKW